MSIDTDTTESFMLLLDEYAKLHRRLHKAYLIILVGAVLLIAAVFAAASFALHAQVEAARQPPPALRSY